MNKERAEQTGPKELPPKIKIGIIDDSDDYVDSLTAFLDYMDISVIKIASTSADALIAAPNIGNQGFCAILVDKNLGHFDGSVVAKEIKRLWPDLPVIGIPSFRDATVYGADYQLFKGAGPDALLDLIKNISKTA